MNAKPQVREWTEKEEAPPTTYRVVVLKGQNVLQCGVRSDGQLIARKDLPGVVDCADVTSANKLALLFEWLSPVKGDYRVARFEDGVLIEVHPPHPVEWF